MEHTIKRIEFKKKYFFDAGAGGGGGARSYVKFQYIIVSDIVSEQTSTFSLASLIKCLVLYCTHTT